MKKEIYATYAAGFTGREVILYCFSKDITNVNNFILTEALAQLKAIEKHYRIFDIFETKHIGYTAVCLN